jgi:pimeloyl-ACP methyl ester carboxylesterase
VVEALCDIQIPTLILHREDDKSIPIRNGSQLATEIPDALFKILDGTSHPPWYGEPKQIIEEILDFLGKKETP